MEHLHVQHYAAGSSFSKTI